MGDGNFAYFVGVLMLLMVVVVVMWWLLTPQSQPFFVDTHTYVCIFSMQRILVFSSTLKWGNLEQLQLEFSWKTSYVIKRVFF